MPDADAPHLPNAASAALAPSHRAVLGAFKRLGRTTVRALAVELELNIETVRDHLRTLVDRGLVRRDGAVRAARGRPEIAFALTAEADRFFPRREGEVLRELGAWLVANRRAPLLERFFEEYVGARRERALARVAGLHGRARLEEVRRILDEMGFMPVLEEPRGGGDARLRLCHCPLRDLVDATRVPCRAELALLAELLGDEPSRVSYIPSGDASCSYTLASRRRAR